MEDPASADFHPSSPMSQKQDDGLDDLRHETSPDHHQLVYPEGSPVPSTKRSHRKRSKKGKKQISNEYDESLHASAHHAVAGASLAGMMAGSLTTTTSQGKLVKRKGFVNLCLAVGAGTLCVGVLWYLWKKSEQTEKKLRETAEDLRKISLYLETEQALADEPLPSNTPAPISIGVEEDKPKIEELPSPPRNLYKHEPNRETRSNGSIGVKKRIAKKAVVNLDFDVDAVHDSPNQITKSPPPPPPTAPPTPLTMPPIDEEEGQEEEDALSTTSVSI